MRCSFEPQSGRHSCKGRNSYFPQALDVPILACPRLTPEVLITEAAIGNVGTSLFDRGEYQLLDIAMSQLVGEGIEVSLRLSFTVDV